MGWIVGDGFDYYGAVADMARSVWDSATTTGVTLQGGANPRFPGGQCIAISGGLFIVTKTIGSNESTLFVAIAHYRVGALSGTSPELYLQFRDGATAQCTIVFESGGAITLKRGTQTGTVVATYPAAFVQDVWTHFQLRVVIHGTAGTFAARKNGQTTDTFAATGLNTQSTANAYATVVAAATAASPNNRVDDLLFYAGSGAAPNTWIGDTRAVCLMPVADTAVKAFSRNPVGPENYTAVNEPIATGDTNFVFSSTVGQEDLYDMAEVTDTPIAIIGVVSKAYIKKSDAGARNGQLRVRSGATDADGPDTVLASTYTYLSKVHAVDPATGTAWTIPGLNALQVGQKVTG